MGTAGHIDHGKSALVEAITGTHPDRLQEEIERGITIDLGFADTEIGDMHVAFVDVPGHERFVRNMLAGVGGIDAVLLVIAADESVMPQTREHLAICEMLGIRSGVVALTKCDLVDHEMRELVELEVAELLEETLLDSAPIVATSATTGSGLDELRAALLDVLTSLEERTSKDALRLPIDRVFTVHGFGTVVTGTLLAGELRAGQQLAILPGDRRVSVRGLQVHGEATEAARAGQRTAVNLQGVDAVDVARGMVLTRPDSITPSHVLDVELATLPGYPLKHHQRIRFHHGAAEILGRVALMTGNEIAGGAVGYGQLRLERAYPGVPGDRAVLRRYSPVITIGGATILDAHPGKRRRSEDAAAELRELAGADDMSRLRSWILAAGGTGVSESVLVGRSGRDADAATKALSELAAVGDVMRIDRGTGEWIAASRVVAARERVATTVDQFHDANPLRPGIELNALRAALGGASELAIEAALAELVADGVLIRDGATVAAARHEIALGDDLHRLQKSLLAAFASAGMAAPPPDEVLERVGDSPNTREIFHMALRDGALLRIADNYVVASAAVEQLIEDLRRQVDRGEAFSIAQFKEWTGLSRRHSIPVLEYLDGARITRREGDGRVLT